MLSLEGRGSDGGSNGGRTAPNGGGLPEMAFGEATASRGAQSASVNRRWKGRVEGRRVSGGADVGEATVDWVRTRRLADSAKLAA